MTIPNPFRYNQPTSLETFVGRCSLVENIVSDLIQPVGDSWAIIGGRRFGKSSVLQVMAHRLQEHCNRRESGERLVLPVLVDLKRCKPESEQYVYACIARYLYRELRQATVPGFELTTTRINTVAKGGYAPLSFFDFEDLLDDLTLRMEGVLGSVRLVLLLDEVEAMTHHEWSETLFNQLRSLIYSGPLASTVKIVLTGAANIIRIEHAGSPLLNAVKIEHLKTLDTTAIQELIAHGGLVPDAVAQAVQTQSGGHPFIAQYLLHHLWKDGLAYTKPQEVAVMAHHLCHNRAADLQGWWEAIGDSGRWAYAALVGSGDWVRESDLLQITRGATQPLDWGLVALCYHGLVVRHNDWEHYRVAGQLFADWFKFRAEQHLSETQGNLEHAQFPPEAKIYYIGTQTNINGTVGTVASGQFQSAAAIAGGEAVDQRQAQGPLYKPQNTVEQDFNTKGVMRMTHFEHGYALLIGVDENAVAKWALPDVAKDIAALHEVLIHPERCAYLADNVKTLTGKEATRQGILDGLEWLAARVQQDTEATAVVYYTGHGWRDKSKTPAEFYLIPYDVKDPGLQTRALRATDFAAEIANMKPNRLLVILDCCHAAGMGVKDVAVLPSGYITAAPPPTLFMEGETSSAAAGAKGLEALAQGRGRAVLSASTGEQSSYIRKDRKMSIFTYHLIEALTGHAQPQEGAKEVLVSDVMSYVTRKVPPSAQADCSEEQTPDYQVSGNFPVALLLGGKGLSKGQPAPEPGNLEMPLEQPGKNTVFDQRDQTVGTQTNIAGNVTGPILSGQFDGPVAVGGGEAVDMRSSQGAMYKPSGPIKQHFGNQETITGDRKSSGTATQEYK